MRAGAGGTDAVNKRDWHRLFGLLLTDSFAGSRWAVELERDLSKMKQLLDVVIVRKSRGRVPPKLPDGLDDLTDYNLITFKSHHEALDAWALKELIGHYVNYRKQISPSVDDLLPEDRFKLYAVCARYPHNLAGQVPLRELRQGVYECRWGADAIRVVVTSLLPRERHNAPLLLFAGNAGQVEFGASHFERRSEETSTLLLQLFKGYNREGLAVSYTMKDFRRDFIKDFLKDLTPQERREALQSLSAEERLAGLSAVEVEALLQRLKAQHPSEQRKPRRKK